MKQKGVWRMPTIRLRTALNDIQDAGLENAPMKVEVHGVTIFTTEQVFNEFADNYDTYVCRISDLYQPTTAAFAALYIRYRDNTKEQLYRAYQAITAQYDPVSNYDMTEQSADGKKLSTETVTPYGGTETKTTTNRTGMNSTDPGVLADTVTTDMTPKTGAKTETSFANDKSVDFDGTTHTGYHEGSEHFLKRSGNIGVTESSTMVGHEMDLRKRDLLREWVKQFIDRYCYSVGGDCGDCLYL